MSVYQDVRTVFEFLRRRKLWWLAPLVLLLLLLGVVIVLAEGSSLAPLIYTIF